MAKQYCNAEQADTPKLIPTLAVLSLASLAVLTSAASQLSLNIDDSDASYPLSNGPSFEQQAYLKASNTDGGDFFGWSVAISGETLVVGARNEDSNASGINGDQNNDSAVDAGAAYVFTRSGTVWSQQAYLKASNTDIDDLFGLSVAISGDTLVVGTRREDSNASGINGDQSDNSAIQAGAAYVFTRSGTVWNQQAYLKASNTDKHDLFGFSVAISGDTLVVGAYPEASNATGINGDQSDNSVEFAGAAYVFTRSGMTWSQQAYLKASNTDKHDLFGFSVAISGDTVVVGASGEDSNATGINGDENDNSAENAGAVYVFTRNEKQWSQQAYLKASNTGAGDDFGASVAIFGDTLMIGAQLEASNATGINGDQSDNSAIQAGAAYVFTRSGMTWSQQAYLKASNTDAGDMFGISLAIFGDTLVVGAYPENSNATGINGDQSDNSFEFAGAAYVFNRNGMTWNQQAYLKASNTDAFDGFGHSVGISGDTLVVSGQFEDSNATGINGDQSDNSEENTGAAYVFIDTSSTQDFTINAGHAGAWFNPATAGQGQFIDVEPAEKFMFISWFTYTDAASANPNDQRWLTAQGNYSGNTATLDLFETLGGKFDDPQAVTTTQIGEVTLSFNDCGQGLMTYSLDEEKLQGEFPLLRVIPGSDNVCEDLAGTSPQAVDINAGMDGAWFDPNTPGQGFFIDAHPDPEGGNFIFVSWFTYGDDTASGQRWLTAQGSFEGSIAEIDVFETTGGSFDDPQAPSTTNVGTMSLDFTDCSNAQLAYSLPATGAEGDIAITRVIPGVQALCEELVGQNE
ncbi:MAG: FG-GAP repeat protein [Proteobacteria bacterium]|nr:FG-GAP repeat protein [Pseudomonadota bacterium]